MIVTLMQIFSLRQGPGPRSPDRLRRLQLAVLVPSLLAVSMSLNVQAGCKVVKLKGPVRLPPHQQLVAWVDCYYATLLEVETELLDSTAVPLVSDDDRQPLIFPVEPFAAGVMIAAAALPVAGNVFILAQHYRVAPQRVSAAILFSTTFSVVTVAAALAWIEML